MIKGEYRFASVRRLADDPFDLVSVHGIGLAARAGMRPGVLTVQPLLNVHQGMDPQDGVRTCHDAAALRRICGHGLLGDGVDSFLSKPHAARPLRSFKRMMV